MKEVMKKYIHGNTAQERIASAMFELGLNIKENGFYYCGRVKVNEAAMAEAIGIDRRSLYRFSKKVRHFPELKSVFCNIMPSGYSSEKIARKEGNGLIKVKAFAKKSGIIANVTRILSLHNIVILQMTADNPETTRSPELVIITEKKVPSTIKRELEKLPNIKKAKIW